MRHVFLLFTISALFFYSYPSFAVRYHVNINHGKDTNDGLKWSSAFQNIQAALDTIKDGDEIWIAAGVYHPTKKIADVYGSKGYETKPTTDRHRSFLINKDVAIYGGFSRNPTDAAGLNSRNWMINQTVLSGDFNDDDGDNFENMEENAYHVVILFDASSSMVLDGLVITGGCADDIATTYTGDERYYYVTGKDGGGIYAYSPNKESSPTLTDVSFYGNYAQNAGGGMFNFAYAQNASPRMTNVSFLHNKALDRHGGGLFNNAGGAVHAELVNINVVGNESWLSGGGLYFISIEECAPTITNTVVNGNFAGFGNGGGIYMTTYHGNVEPVIINTTICGNRVGENNRKDGGGLVIDALGMSFTTIINSVIWGNKGNQIDNFYAGGDWGDDNVFIASLIEGFDDLGQSNLPGNTNPKFLEPVPARYAPTMDGDYQLTLESPLINKGINSYNSVLYDLLGQPRKVNGIIDIGAYESQGIPPVFNETAFSEKAIWSYHKCLYVQIYQQVSLSIYSVDGALVKHVPNLSEGTHQFSLPNGIYIVTLSNGIVEKVVIK